MVFDAVSAHWTQANVVSIEDERQDKASEKMSWGDLYFRYPDFRRTMAGSLSITDVFRGDLLKPVEEYVKIRFEAGCVREVIEEKK